MKKIIALFSTVFVAVALLAPVNVYAYCGSWPFPSCTPIPTPTPTTGLIHMLVPTFKAVMPLTTVTSTPTNSPTPTATLTPTLTPTVTVAPSVTVTPEAAVSPQTSISEAPVPTVTPAQPQTLVMGFTLKEVAFAVVAIALLIILIVQSNWTKIKTWLHEKTS